MNVGQKRELIRLAERSIPNDDPSHDLLHTRRVLALAERIAAREGADPEIVIPAALFHDVVVLPKNDPRSRMSQTLSARKARRLLARLKWYPDRKIPAVARAIERCSFSQDLPKETVEEQVLQDADLLESVGAVAIARTFCSSGQMKRRFYDPDDPRGKNRPLAPKQNALDLFPVRLFQAGKRLTTRSARLIAKRREKTLRDFYRRFLAEIGGH